MIDIKVTAQAIFDVLQYCDFDDVTDSSGYYIIKEFADGTERAVDVYKSTNDGNPHYVIYCSYEDELSNYYYTEDLSVESLEKQLRELCEEYFTVHAEGIEITGTRERLKELVSYIRFEDSEPSNALADVVSEIELELDLK